MITIAIDSSGWTDLPKDMNQQQFMEVVAVAAGKVEKLLTLPKNLTAIIKPNLPHVIDVNGVGASTWDAELFDITFDPKRAGDKDFFDHISASVFHECNHVARYYSGVKAKVALDWILSEGLATVFEREYSGVAPKWGEYDPKEIKDWTKEVLHLGENFNWGHYMFKNPDGRRWIGYKVGTYLIDKAIKNSGKSIIELTTATYADIKTWAKVK